MARARQPHREPPPAHHGHPTAPPCKFWNDKAFFIASPRLQIPVDDRLRLTPTSGLGRCHIGSPTANVSHHCNNKTSTWLPVPTQLAPARMREQMMGFSGDHTINMTHDPTKNHRKKGHEQHMAHPHSDLCKRCPHRPAAYPSRIYRGSFNCGSSHRHRSARLRKSPRHCWTSRRIRCTLPGHGVSMMWVCCRWK